METNTKFIYYYVRAHMYNFLVFELSNDSHLVSVQFSLRS